MKTRVKGNRIQRKAIEVLEKSGYLVSKAEQGGKFNKEKDLFGLFDLVALKRGICLFVQVTTNTPHTHGPYIEFSKQYHNNGIEFWQFVHHDRKGWVKFRYQQGGKIKYDLRKNN